MGTADLYGNNDPFQRMPRSPKQLEGSPGLEELIVKVLYCVVLYCTVLYYAVGGPGELLAADPRRQGAGRPGHRGPAPARPHPRPRARAGRQGQVAGS